ncbi:tripartite tricarboxylate transporter substrate binding protein [Alcaligenaceae bacterium]|nr:tripartite tricarboxylate transporter substrate binding protein [Alcaligenaceae bacterium]
MLSLVRSSISCLLLATVSAIGMAGAAQAAYPEKPISIVVPYSPGGTNDVVARLLARKLGEQMAQTVIVENKVGASGNIGADTVARSTPDGYTLVLVTMGHSIHPSMYKNLRYDITKDLAPIARLSSGPMLVMVNPDLPVRNFAELVAMAKSKPGELNYASAGNGSSTHLATELIDHQAGIKMVHIPYGGSAPAMVDVIAGNAQVVLDLMFSALPQVQSGKLRAVGITSKLRSPLLPDVPTIAESNVPGLEGFDAEVWNGLMAPAGTPKPIIDRLNAELKTALADPEIKQRLDAQGFPANWSTPSDFGALIKADIARWAEVVKVSGARVE